MTEKTEPRSPRKPVHNYTEECPARKKGMVQCTRPSLDCRECVESDATRAMQAQSPRSTRNLTKDEILALPFDLKICFFLQGWNAHPEIKTVDDWAKIFGINFCRENESCEAGTLRAREKATNIINFLRKYCVSRAVPDQQEKELKSYTGAYVMYLEGGNIVVTGREKFKNFKAVFVMHEAEGFFRSCFLPTPPGTLPCPELIEVETEPGLKEWVCRAVDAKSEREQALADAITAINNRLAVNWTPDRSGLTTARTLIESLQARQEQQQ